MSAQQNASRRIRELYVSDGERTFQFDDQLPPLPLPKLSDTLTRYLDSVRHLVDRSDWENTRKLVQQFESTTGPRLQAYLQAKANKEQNWLEEWWNEYAYLRGRQSLLPFSNMSAALPPPSFWPQTTKPTEIAYRVALTLRFTLDFYCLLRDERMRPMLHKNHYWSMDQFRRLFSTCRVPQQDIDRLITYFKTRYQSDSITSKDIVIMFKGHVFRIAGFEANDEVCSIRKLYEQIKSVLEHPQCEKGKGPAIPALTSAPRDRWAKNRNRLIELSDRNRLQLDCIERSLFTVSFDLHQPQNANEQFQYTMCGPADDRWADKSICNIFYANGVTGALCDHTPFDGFVSALLTHYVLTCINECAGRWPESATNSSLNSEAVSNEVKLLEFDLDQQLRNEVAWAQKNHAENCQRLNTLTQSFNGYGKKMLKSIRLHPEALIQVALQVAYEKIRQKYPKLHQSPATCYCTASTRQFYNGRTETVRSCTTEAKDLADLIITNKNFNTNHFQALQKATNKFQQLMSDAMNGQGIDRHFLGLYLATLELGEELPEMFTDPTFSVSGSGGNYVLSTSCAGYWNITGGVPPMREDGYGVFYGIEDDAFHFAIIEYQDNRSTDAYLFFETICETLQDFEQISIKAKL